MSAKTDAGTIPPVRYCAGCGSIGEVGPQHINCCPDGGALSMYVPRKIAEACRETFLLSIAPHTERRAVVDEALAILRKYGMGEDITAKQIAALAAAPKLEASQ